MNRITAILATLTILPATAFAHDNQSETFTDGDTTCITSNGAPNHDMGRFPNQANPNTFREQTLSFCFPTEPQMAQNVTHELMTVGVSLTGVPFRPYTAGYYDPNGRGNIGDNPASGWRQQAMHDPRRLGMDRQNAHVDRSGLYHYHGVSEDYLGSMDGTLIGFAPDGFEIHYLPDVAKSSWQLKSGTRPTAPFGPYDGTFEEDFEYTAGSSALDECNGARMDGVYTYFATDTYPYFPRCFKGVVNPRFMTRP
ncbi:YHYH protein [uncultured Tateyamaria sp.]|uniref:YHYH protein n=1 Tax=uncultured Tateyamaria sp. TaxID=455651 RepID=UPI00262C84CB|nr:YHYH protein [uncultured Tateyamaria sp.]